ncbi:MAG: protease modulator HflC [Alphaproteobacteria bacterium]|nr:protease modulator HflC [Alphaproteobacteria bacterium]
MNRIALTLVGALSAMAVFGLFTSVFVVHQTNQALVLRFQNPVRVISEPGLYFKVPLMESVVYYDSRVLSLDPPPDQMILSDQKRVIVDGFARYRITDPLEFYTSVTSESNFANNFGGILSSTMRSVLARTDLSELLSERRGEIMRRVQEAVTDEAKKFGVLLVDVRIGRTELPEDVLANVYQRMRSEREREANLLRAEGEENARRIRATADRERTVLLAEAERQSQVLRGEGEATRNRVLGEAYGKDHDFFDFYRSLEAYKTTFLAEGTTLVLSPDTDFFRYFSGWQGKFGTDPVAAPPPAKR